MSMSKYWAFAPGIAAAIGAGLTAAVSYYPHAGWVPVALALCTMLATHTVANVPSNVAPTVAPAPSPGASEIASAILDILHSYSPLEESSPHQAPATVETSPTTPQVTFSERTRS